MTMNRATLHSSTDCSCNGIREDSGRCCPHPEDEHVTYRGLYSKLLQTECSTCTCFVVHEERERVSA